MRGKIKKGIALVLSAVLTVATCITTKTKTDHVFHPDNLL